jgi:hypothetical protein
MMYQHATEDRDRLIAERLTEASGDYDRAVAEIIADDLDLATQ